LAAAANAAAAAPSATLLVVAYTSRIAAATSASVTRTMRSTLLRMISNDSASGLRQARPSASWVDTSASTRRPASSDSA
jgi:hypothetical protein